MKLRNISYILFTIMMTFVFTSCNNKCKHKETMWIVDVKATCTENGSKHEECTICHEKLGTKEIKALGHTYDNQGICTRCGYESTTDEIVYELNPDNISYKVVGLRIEKNTFVSTIIVPSEYNNLPVTEIGANAFSDCYFIKLIISEGIDKIDKDAFNYLRHSIDLVLPKSIANIEENVFGDIYLNNVYYNGTIEDWCNIKFSNSASNPISKATNSYILDENNEYKEIAKISEIVIPGTINRIGDYQFLGFDSIKKVTFSEGVKEIGNSAFAGCENIAKVEMANTITSIGVSAFAGNSSLIDIVLPSNIKTIESKAFTHCGNVTNVYYNGTLEDWCNIELIDQASNPFYYNDRNLTNHFYMLNKNSEYEELTKLVIPSTVKKINSRTFSDFNNLESIVIPNTVETIGEQVFSGCTSLTNIILPFIGDGNNINKFGYIFGNHVPSSLKEVKITDAKQIAERAFSGCKEVESITIDGVATSIEDEAFSGCTKLNKIEILCNITSINRQAFSNCTSLTSITIPNTVKEFGHGAFYNCTSLTNVYFRGTLEEWRSIRIMNATSTPESYAEHIYVLDKNNEYVEIDINN